jgi:hypothetical protein
MYRTTAACKTVEQTTSSPGMLRVVLQNVPCSNSFQDFIECNIFLNHFSLGVLGNANVLRLSFDTYLLQYSFQTCVIASIHLLQFHIHFLPRGISANGWRVSEVRPKGESG